MYIKSLISPHPPINAREEPDVNLGFQEEERKTFCEGKSDYKIPPNTWGC
jgi:hypothetical protein